MAPQIYSLQFGINSCYLICDEGCIMIDAGPPGKGKAFIRQMDKLSVPCREVQLMVLTHGDFDHVGSAKEIKKITGAQVAIHEPDHVLLEGNQFHWPPGVTPWGKWSHFLFAPLFKKMTHFEGLPADIVLRQQEYPLDSYGIKGKILYTPGHTKGSVSVLLDSGEAFVGCLAHNRFPFTTKPRLPIYAEDIQGVKDSWKYIIGQGARMIYPGHGKPFPVEAVEKYLI